MTKKLVALVLLIAACASAQVMFYDGSSNLKYVCTPRSDNYTVTTSWSVSGATLTNIVVASNVATVTTAAAHYLYPGAYITVAGSTGNTLNGTFVLTDTPTATTATFAITTSNTTDTASTLTVSTKNPPLNVSYWAIQVLNYVSGSLRKVTSVGPGASASYSLKCSDRASY